MLKKVLAVSAVIIIALTVFSACEMWNRRGTNYDVNFESNGGSYVSPMRTDGRSALTLPEAPTREGYIFNGWFRDNDTFSRQFQGDTLTREPIQDNMTLYAKWIKASESKTNDL